MKTDLLKECILYGSVLKEHEEKLLQRLRGLCDPGQHSFNEHEMVFSLSMSTEVIFTCSSLVGIVYIKQLICIL